VIIRKKSIENEGSQIYKKTTNNKSIDYPPALTDLTTCNFSSRNGTPISAVTIHTVQGSYAGCISWFKNCSANVSALLLTGWIIGIVYFLLWTTLLFSKKAWSTN